MKPKFIDKVFQNQEKEINSNYTFIFNTIKF